MIIQEWIVVFQQVSNCYVPTLILFFLLSFAWLTFVWSTHSVNPKGMGISAIIQITFYILICCLCGFLGLGFLIVPEHTEYVAEIVGIMPAIHHTSTYVQTIILWILRKLA